MSEAKTEYATMSVPDAIRSVMHSEHCSYKSTRRYLAELPTTGEYVIQGPGENAGIMRLGQGLALALRIESHNHPSFIDPWKGSATGVGGIIRDIFTMGARPIALIDNLRFGNDQRAQWLLKGVAEGISRYGTTIGIPVVGGDIYFDKTYNGNNLVNVCCMGLVPEKNIIYGNALSENSDLIYVGARTGRDGMGGANFASLKFDPNAPRDEKAIQDDDPFLEKLLLEACVELRDTDWLEGMQDMGAAGLLCSTTEVIHRGQKKTGLPLGARVYLDRIPTKENGMSAAELLCSESQERMMIVGKRPFREEIMEKFRRWDLEAVVVGEVTRDSNYTLVYTKDGQEQEESMTIKEICEPVDEEWPLEKWQTQGGKHSKAAKPTTTDVWRQYDWRVGVRTIKGPNQPGHFAILDLPEIDKELVVSWSSDEGRSDIDPTMGIEHAFQRAYRYIEDNKAIPLGLTNCLNFGHPKDSMGAFAETVEGLGKMCRNYEVPVVSGNVSLYNSTGEHPIKPTPVLVMVGIKNK